MRVFDLFEQKNDKIRILTRKDWKHEAPTAAYEAAIALEKEGIGATIGHHDDHGYYVGTNATGTTLKYAEDESLYDLNRVEEQY